MCVKCVFVIIIKKQTNKLDNKNFARYEIGGEISVTILVFILDHFQEKLNISKSLKTLTGSRF